MFAFIKNCIRVRHNFFKPVILSSLGSEEMEDMVPGQPRHKLETPSHT
jgi:hypothetical protein